MPPAVIVKSNDVHVRAWREKAARRVIADFGNHLPEHRLLYDHDWQPFKRAFGEANRGFYKPLRDAPLPYWPDYLRSTLWAANTLIPQLDKAVI
jgi:hypothetical protein